MFILLSSIRWEPRDLLKMNWTQRLVSCSKSEGAFQTPKETESIICVFKVPVKVSAPVSCVLDFCVPRSMSKWVTFFSPQTSQFKANESTILTFHMVFVFAFVCLKCVCCEMFSYVRVCARVYAYICLCVCVHALPCASCVLLHAEGVSVRLQKWISPQLTPLLARSCMGSP